MPARPQPAQRRLSYSSLQDYARCGYRFYLTRVLGLPRVTPPPRRADGRRTPRRRRAARGARCAARSCTRCSRSSTSRRPRAARRAERCARSARAHGLELDAAAGRRHPGARRGLRAPRRCAPGSPRRAASAARPASPSRSSPAAAARSSRGFVDVLAREADGDGADRRLQDRPARRGGDPGRAGRARLRAPSAWSTRSPRCRTARRASRSPTACSSAPASRSSRDVRPQADAPALADALLRARRRACSPSDWPVAAEPAPRAVRRLPGPARALLLAGGDDAAARRRRPTRRPAPWPAASGRRSPAGSSGRAAQVDRRVELGAEQQHDVRQPEPDEQDHRAGERAVGRRVRREVRDVDEEQRRGDDPREDAEDRARA